jgi:uncharacterized protein (TIGR02145 family)
MAENLNYRYLGPTAELDSSSFCYNDDPAHCETYGRLYLWSAAMDSAGIIDGNTANGCGFHSECSRVGTVRGVCPKGWHLPSRPEWKALIVAVDGSITEYGHNMAGSKLKSISGWNSSGNGTDDYVFSALPAGYREDNGNYYAVGRHALFWSPTEDSEGEARCVALFYNRDNADLGFDVKNRGFSVRCIKD